MAQPINITEELLPLTPNEALDFFKQKGFDLQGTKGWLEFSPSQHASAFTVAQSAGYDILGDIHKGVEEAIANGTTKQKFIKDLKPLLQAKGWWGKKTVIDELTGEEREIQLGSPRRLSIIFETNLRMSYMAGKFQAMMRVKEDRPWWRYVTIGDSHVRAAHRPWHGMILRWDDPWWRTHFPPNGFNCRCSVMNLSDRDLKDYGWTPDRAPTSLPRTYINRTTGQVTSVPQGIQPGFDHNVGILAMEANSGKRLADRILSLPPAIAAQVYEVSKRYVLSGVSYEYQSFIDAVMRQGFIAAGSLRVIQAFPKEALPVLNPTSAAIVIDDITIQRLIGELDAILALELKRLPHHTIKHILRQADGKLMVTFENNLTATLSLNPTNVWQVQALKFNDTAQAVGEVIFNRN